MHIHKRKTHYIRESIAILEFHDLLANPLLQLFGDHISELDLLILHVFGLSFLIPSMLEKCVIGTLAQELFE